MGLASAIGQTFQMPTRQLQGGQAQAQQQQQQQAGGSVLGAPPSGLENVDNVTQAFYDKWGELESFASDMKLQYGIDVTRPDFSTSEGMEAHKMYQKALADLRYQGNALKASQAELSNYQKAQASSYGDRVSYGGIIGQGRFDSNKINIAPTLSTTGQVTDKDRYKTKTAIELENLKHQNDLAEIEKKAGVEEGEFAGVAAMAADVGTYGQGRMEWTINEKTGVQESSMLQGGYYKKRDKDGKIKGWERDDNGDIFLVYGGDERGRNTKRQEVNEDTALDVYNGLIDGKYTSATERDKAARYIRGLEKKRKGLFDMGREDTKGYLEQAKQSVTKYNTAQTNTLIEDLTTKADKSGNLNDFNALMGEGDPPVIGVRSRRGIDNGFYTITFEGGDEVIIGGTEYGKNNQVIREILSAGETAEATPPQPTDIYIVNGEEYTYEQMLSAKDDDGNPWTEEDIKKHAKRK